MVFDIISNGEGQVLETFTNPQEALRYWDEEPDAFRVHVVEADTLVSALSLAMAQFGLSLSARLQAMFPFLH